MKTFAHDRSENHTDRRILRADLRGGERAFGKRVFAAALVEQMVSDHEDFVEMP